jgi:hypothetical protein
MKRRKFFLLAILAAASAMPATGQTQGLAQGAASIPDFSRFWRHQSLPGLEPLASGPTSLTNRSRRNGVSNYNELVGDYTNPILKPEAAAVVKKKGELSIAGVTYPSPANQCWPEPVPFIFKNFGMMMLQRPQEVTILYDEGPDIRHVRMNQPHPAKLTPSWYGDSVGHYEGDTLVIDTVGIRTDRPHAMIDLFGTPYTEKLHVVERYRLVDYDDAKDAMQRGAKENRRAGGPYNPNYEDKYLQVQFTIEDAGAFTTPWSATMIYLRDRDEFPEVVCAEGRFGFHNHDGGDLPQAAKPDF